MNYWERPEEPRVIDLRRLAREDAHARREDQLEQRTRRPYSPKH